MNHKEIFTVLIHDPVKLNEMNSNPISSTIDLYLLPKNSREMVDKIWKEYFPVQKNGSSSDIEIPGKEITAMDLANLTTSIGGRSFYSCAKESTIYHAKYAPVYLYYLNKKLDIGYGYILETSRSSLPHYMAFGIAYIKYIFYHNVFGWDVDDYGKILLKANLAKKTIKQMLIFLQAFATLMIFTNCLSLIMHYSAFHITLSNFSFPKKWYDCGHRLQKTGTGNFC